MNTDALMLDWAKEADRISLFIRNSLIKPLKRKGLIVALSGGIDSSTVAALCVKAIGKEKVFGLLMPEQDSSADTLDLSREIVEFLNIDYHYEDISPILCSTGCYNKRNNAIREVIPEFEDHWKVKITLPSILESNKLRLFSAVIEKPDGTVIKKQLNYHSYLGIVAATNFKQRVRKMLEYYHADRLNYAVAGTPNRLEYDQGFFVKLGDGAADIKPIAHLYKTQVYEMAKFLKIPENIIKRPPTTDTYSLSQSQDEFYFSLPYDKMDICLFAYNNNISKQEVSKSVGLTEEQIERVFRDIEQKRRTAQYLHAEPQIIEKILN
ncbi:MAG: NAD(+) synthase [Spirochaetes bacterium]|nr:NAD(+) synthase [Spirochaetota bacterium]